jgi:hypothetical protein
MTHVRSGAAVLYLLLAVLVAACAEFEVNYAWPVVDYDSSVEKKVFGVFMEPRTPDSAHLHTGIDIRGEADSSHWLQPISLVYEPFSYGPTSNGHGVLLGVYQHDCNDELSRRRGDSATQYLHMTDVFQYIKDAIRDNDTLWYQEPFWYADSTRHLYQDHVHLDLVLADDQQPQEDWVYQYMNPFVNESLRVDDSTPPQLDSVWLDCGWQVGAGHVSSWSFLGKTFDTTTTGFAKLTRVGFAANDDPASDWDDPHFSIDSSPYKVRFYLKCHDANAWYPYDLAPYRIYMGIDDDIYDDAQDPSRLMSANRMWFALQFDTMKNPAQEQDREYLRIGCTYSLYTPLVTSSVDPRYYVRLFPYTDGSYTPPCAVLTTDEPKTESLSRGVHRVRLVAYDWAANRTDRDFYFYLKKEEDHWVDYCRGLTE